MACKFTRHCLSPTTTKHLRTWRLIFHHQGHFKTSGISYFLFQLAFSVPLANAGAERLFSHMKRIKIERAFHLVPDDLKILCILVMKVHP